MKLPLPIPAWFLPGVVLAFAPLAAQAGPPLGELQQEFRQVESGNDPLALLRRGRPLRDRLVEAKDYPAAAEVALKVAFAADLQGTPAEAVEAAGEARRIVGLSRAGRMRAWDWMLQAQMSGLAVKHLIHEGRLSLASQRQAEAWESIRRGVREETARDWQPGPSLPPGISGDLLNILLRTARYEGELLSLAGRNVEAVTRMRALEADLTRSGMPRGVYGGQLLGFLVGEQEFLGFRTEALALQDRLIAQAGPDSHARHNALFNRAYWRSQWEGPIPELLQEAKAAAAAATEANSNATNTTGRRRLLAKMAFAYQEAGFEIGDLVALVKEAEAAGDEMEALYTRRDLAVIQRQTRDFAPAEANLLTALSAARAVGRKRAEPNLYQEYAILLSKTGRPREAIRMARESIRLTKSFQWTQHLPGLLHVLANAQQAAGDGPGLRATLAELEALLASGKLEAYRALDASVAIALCQHALARPQEGTATLQRALTAARQQGVPAWQIDLAEKFPFGDLTLARFIPGPPLADLQPLKIHSTVLPDETARVRFTLSNPSAATATGTLVLEGGHLTADWQDGAGVGRITWTPPGGERVLRRPVTLAAGEEFLLTAEAAAGLQGTVSVRWEAAGGAVQQSAWTLTSRGSDGTDLAISNASLAGRNPFYALRLHHALHRRGGDPAAPVDLRVVASRPVRIELLHPDTGELLAVDANGDGQLDGAGDVLLADANHDGFADLLCASGTPAEVALLIYPLTTTEPPGELSLDIQLRNATGWETAARNLLK